MYGHAGTLLHTLALAEYGLGYKPKGKSMPTIKVFVRAEGGGGYAVGYQPQNHQGNSSGPPVVLARYTPDLTTIPPTTHAECHAKAQAHRQGMLDGMRVIVNAAESLIPTTR